MGKPFVCAKHDRSGYSDDGHCPQCKAEITGAVRRFGDLPYYGAAPCEECKRLRARIAGLEAVVKAVRGVVRGERERARMTGEVGEGIDFALAQFAGEVEAALNRDGEEKS